MPSAGAVIPPTIIPLRNPLLNGKPTSHIDTKTYIELETGILYKDCFVLYSSILLLLLSFAIMNLMFVFFIYNAVAVVHATVYAMSDTVLLLM